MKTWDAVIIGGGIIGLSLARAVRKRGASVLVVERGEPGREASHAAAGMIAACDPHLLPPLVPLAAASAAIYPEFVHELEDESGMHVDLRSQGTIALFDAAAQELLPATISRLDVEELNRLEPALEATFGSAFFMAESSVDPRALVAASLKAAKHRAVDIASGATAQEIEVSNGRAVAVRTLKTRYPASAIVNCCGPWAGTLPPRAFPTRPVKGQMLTVIPLHRGLISHVVRAPEVYLVPRSDGRVIVGSTLEEAGFDKHVDPETIQSLHQAATHLVPELGQGRMLESWAGLRPGTPDGLPILGATDIPGYFVATGHYRDGIMLAPITAQLMSQVIDGLTPQLDLHPFSFARF